MKIVFLDANTLGGEDLSAFSEFGEVIVHQKSTPEQARERAADADVVVINKIIIDEAFLAAAPKLKLVLISATGTNNIDFAATSARGVVVKNVAGYSTKSVVQHTFALLFALMNATSYYDAFTKRGDWCKSEHFCDYSRRINTVEGKTYGVIGMGAIGRGVAQIASALGAEVVWASASGAPRDEGYKQLPVDELLARADIVSIHAPLNEHTRGLLDERRLGLLKPGAIVLNLGRGGIVDEAALARAIDERGIRAGLDVLEREPMAAGHPLLGIQHPERLIITPHIAWAAEECVTRLCAMMVNNLRDFLAGH